MAELRGVAFPFRPEEREFEYRSRSQERVTQPGFASLGKEYAI